jgi:hypothetical protein
LILCIYAISKKYLKTKRKTLFGLRFFHLSQGEEKERRGGEPREEKQRRGNTLNRANSNLPGESIARERESIVFVNRGESPLFYKKQYRKQKSEKRSITLKK